MTLGKFGGGEEGLQRALNYLKKAKAAWRILAELQLTIEKEREGQ